MKKETTGILAGAAVLGIAAWLYLHYANTANSTGTNTYASNLPLQNGYNSPTGLSGFTPWGPVPLGPIRIGGVNLTMQANYSLSNPLSYVNNTTIGGLNVTGGNTTFNLQQPNKLLSLFGCSNCGCNG